MLRFNLLYLAVTIGMINVNGVIYSIENALVIILLGKMSTLKNDTYYDTYSNLKF